MSVIHSVVLGWLCASHHFGFHHCGLVFKLVRYLLYSS